jgi:hypothetical protein
MKRPVSVYTDAGLFISKGFAQYGLRETPTLARNSRSPHDDRLRICS